MSQLPTFTSALGISTGYIVRTEFGPDRMYSTGPYRVVEVRSYAGGNYVSLICRNADESKSHLRGIFWINGVHRDGDRWLTGMRSAGDLRGEVFVEKAEPLEPAQMTLQALMEAAS